MPTQGKHSTLKTKLQWPWNWRKASKLVREKKYSFHNAFILSPLSLSSLNRFLTSCDRAVTFTASPPITVPGKAPCVYACMTAHRPVSQFGKKKKKNQRSSFSSQLCCLKAQPVTIHPRVRMRTCECECSSSTDEVTVRVGSKEDNPKVWACAFVYERQPMEPGYKYFQIWLSLWLVTQFLKKQE